MSQTLDEVTQSVRQFVNAVAAAVADEGWVIRDLGIPSTQLAVDRALGADILATAEVRIRPAKEPPGWPVAVYLTLGVGHSTTLDLQPLLTLTPVLPLVAHPDTPPTPARVVSIPSAERVDACAAETAAFILERAVPFASEFATARDVERAMRASEPDPPADDPADPRPPWRRDPRPAWTRDWITARRLTLLAASGAHDDARRQLADFPTHREGPEQRIGQENRRFIRQLTRWLDAGGPTPPPIAETLAQLSPRRDVAALPPLRQAWSGQWQQSKAKSRAREAAVDAVRARARHIDPSELADVVTEEHRNHGVELAGSEVVLIVHMLTQERRRLGRARTALTALTMIGSTATTLLRLLRSSGAATDSENTARPPRATYRAADTGPWVAVDLHHPTTGWTPADLDPADAPAAGPYRHLDVWLTRNLPADNTSPTVSVHLGPHSIGTLPTPAANAFTGTFHAADLFDEDPWTAGRLLQLDGTTVLEIRTPAPPPT